jgi:hypothetical protein
MAGYFDILKHPGLWQLSWVALMASVLTWHNVLCPQTAHTTVGSGLVGSLP